MGNPADSLIDTVLKSARPLVRQAINDWLQQHQAEIAGAIETALLRSLEEALRQGLSKTPLVLISQIMNRF